MLRLMAEDTHLHTVGIAAVKSQLVVTGVATFGSDDIAGNGNRRAVRDEVEGGPCVTDSQVERREIAVAVKGDGGGRRGIKSRRSLSDERVLVLAWAYLRCLAPKFEVRTDNGAQDFAGSRCCGVGNILLLALRDVCGDCG